MRKMNLTPPAQIERAKKRQQRFRSQGLCPTCGSEPKISKKTGKTFVYCSVCIDKQTKRNKEYRGRKKQDKTIIDHPITLTGKRYRVINTGEVGQIEPCPCDDPIVLRFEGGDRHVFFLKQVKVTRKTVTKSDPIHRNSKGGRPKGLAPAKVEKMLAIYEYLLTQDKPVFRKLIDKEVGFTVIRLLMFRPSQSKVVSLESLGIVERSRV